MPAVSCPTCGVALAVPAELVGQTIRCGQCQAQFPAVASPAQRVPEPPLDRARPAPPPRQDDYYDDYRPRRRRRPYYSRLEAQAKVQTPGVLLMVCGIVYMLMGLGCAALMVVGIVSLMNGNPKGRDESDSIAIAIIGSIGAVVLFAASPFLVVGGHKLKSLSSPGWATAGSVAAIILGALMALSCMPLGIPLLLLAIWPLTVLNDPNVKRAMREGPGEVDLREEEF